MTTHPCTFGIELAFWSDRIRNQAAALVYFNGDISFIIALAGSKPFFPGIHGADEIIGAASTITLCS
jgi:hypothetical protein